MYELKYQQIDRQTDTNTQRQRNFKEERECRFCSYLSANIISRIDNCVDKKLLYVCFDLKIKFFTLNLL